MYTFQVEKYIFTIFVMNFSGSKVHPACHNIANGIKPESNSKILISMLWIAQKLNDGRKVIYVRCMNCSYKNGAKGTMYPSP